MRSKLALKNVKFLNVLPRMTNLIYLNNMCPHLLAIKSLNKKTMFFNKHTSSRTKKEKNTLKL